MPTARVLLADDEPQIRRLLALSLTSTGVIVDEAADGAAALELLKERHYDVLVLDLMMPVLSGYEVIEALHELRPRPAVLVVTAMDTARYLTLDPEVVALILRKPLDVSFFRTVVTELAAETAARRGGEVAGGDPGLFQDNVDG